MRKHKLGNSLSLLLAGLLGLSAIQMVQAQEPIYGRELMTEQERIEHRNKMRSLKTEQEREEYRRQHHEKMQQRAKERGVTLPEAPSARGKGMGQGAGQGKGKGKGQDNNRSN